MGYRRAVGGPRFWRDVRGLPRGLASLVRADGVSARVHLFWGAAAGMAAALVLGPSLGLVLSLGVMVALPTIIGNVLSSGAYRAVNAVLGRVSPKSVMPRESGMLSTAVGILGSAFSFAAAFVVTDTALKVALTFGLAAIAFLLSARTRTPPPTAALILLPRRNRWRDGFAVLGRGRLGRRRRVLRVRRVVVAVVERVRRLRDRQAGRCGRRRRPPPAA